MGEDAVHEVSAVRAAVDHLLSAVQPEAGERISAVELLVGVSDHASAEVVLQYFELFTRGTPAEGARVSLLWAPARYRCFACGETFDVDRPSASVTCPDCDGVALLVQHSDVCGVREATVEPATEAGAS